MPKEVNTIRELKATLSRRNLFMITAISLFMLAGFLIALPAHAQTTSSTGTTSSSGIQSGTGTATGHGSGHGCPNMQPAMSGSSSSTSSSG